MLQKLARVKANEARAAIKGENDELKLALLQRWMLSRRLKRSLSRHVPCSWTSPPCWRRVARSEERMHLHRSSRWTMPPPLQRRTAGCMVRAPLKRRRQNPEGSALSGCIRAHGYILWAVPCTQRRREGGRKDHVCVGGRSSSPKPIHFICATHRAIDTHSYDTHRAIHNPTVHCTQALQYDTDRRTDRQAGRQAGTHTHQRTGAETHTEFFCVCLFVLPSLGAPR